MQATVDKLDYYKSTKSKNGNFAIIDTIGVPHAYCITPRHVTYASDHNGGMLTKQSIIEAEEHGAKCGICKGKLKYEQHEQALLVSCKRSWTEDLFRNELQSYLLTLKEQVEQDGFAGFAFKKDFE